MNRPALALLACVLAGCAAPKPQEPAAARGPSATPSPAPIPGDAPMQLGNFSISLAVKDINASFAFYQKLGFKQVAGNLAQRWVILQNDTSTIGLHQGMFERNSLTYNPGWDRQCNTLPKFDDVRDLQRAVKAKGITPVAAADESTTGPASFVLVDPDGNPIIVDQHVPSPKK